MYIASIVGKSRIVFGGGNIKMRSTGSSMYDLPRF